MTHEPYDIALDPSLSRIVSVRIRTHKSHPNSFRIVVYTQTYKRTYAPPYLQNLLLKACPI